MVWTAGDSPLYKCVERFNSQPREESRADPLEPGQTCCSIEPAPHADPECGCKKVTEEQICDKLCDNDREAHRETPKPCDQRHNSAPSSTPHPPNSLGNILQRITGDRDFMLIAALIILLLHEKADMKLIAALAFIILT